MMNYSRFFTIVLLFLASNIFAQEWIESQKVLPVSRMSNEYDRMGYGIAVDGDYAVATTYGYQSNKGCAYVLHFNGTEWNKIAKLSASDGAPGDYFGWSADIHGDVIVIGTPYDDNEFGSAYIFEKSDTGWVDMTETAKIYASDADRDYFGKSVRVHNNYVLVGAPGVNGYNPGHVYLYEKPETGWADGTETYMLSNGEQYSARYFGHSIDMDDNQIIVGAYKGSTDTTYNHGTAYIYEKPEDGWQDMNPTAKIVASDGQSEDRFGWSVAVNDGVVAVGATNDSDMRDDGGVVFIYEKPENGWVDTTETTKLYASNGSSIESFGHSMSFSNDYLLVGHLYYYVNKAYLFKEGTQGWSEATEIANFKPNGGSSFEYFAYSLDMSGDRILIGAPSYSGLNTNGGAVYSYLKPEGAWVTSTQQDQRIDPDPYPNNSGDEYGSSIDIDGNMAVVGSYRSFDSKGCVYVLKNIEGSWQTIATLTASDASESDWFGKSVAINSNTIVVGSPLSSNSRGKVYVFEMPSGGWVDMTETFSLIASNPSDFEKIGESVALSDDYVIVGATGGNDSKGVAYVFENQTGAWVDANEVAVLTASNGLAYDKLGTSVSISNDIVVVGAPGFDDVGGQTGRAYLFEKPSGGWVDMTETAILSSSNPGGNDYFGHDVAVENDVVVVCGQYADISNGAGFLYEKPSGGWVDMTETFTFPAPETFFTRYGVSVDIDNDRIVIGDGEHNIDNDYDVGSACIYEKPLTGWADLTEYSVIRVHDFKKYERFGTTVAISGDYLISGAPYDDEVGTNAGAAYFFKYTDPIEFLSMPVNYEDICNGTTVTLTVSCSNADSYVWQVSLNNGVSYEAIEDNAIFTGSQTTELSILTSPDVEGLLFRCKAFNSEVFGYSDVVGIDFDDESPTITVPSAYSIYADENCQAVVPDFSVIYNLSDNCDSELSIIQDPEPGTIISQSTHDVYLKVTDSFGNYSEKNFQVDMYDTLSPIPVQEALPNIVSSCSIVISEFPTATDNCSGTITGTTIDPLEYTDQGTYIITWTYDDGNGNEATQTQTVIINDQTAPIADVETLPTLSGECSVTVSEAPTATDNCTAIITGTTTDPMEYIAQGTYIITWTYDDGNGNTAAQEQTIVVEDITAPVADVETLPELTAECSLTVSESPTATDNCAGTITATTTDPLEYSAQGTYTITWTYDDGNGNTTIQDQTIVVEDITAPVADVETLPELTAECSLTVSESPTATDNCAGTITATTTDPLEYSAQGTYTITWTYDDGNGNTTTQDQTIVVEDITAPVTDVETLSELTGECSLTVSESPTATDNCAGTITATTSDPLEYTEQGTYTITWTFDDGNGNTATQQQTVIVDDVTAPVVSCIENQVIDLSEGETEYVVSGTEFDPVESSDNCSNGTLLNDYNNSQSLDGAAFPIDTTMVTWTITDNAGNTSECSFEVVVNGFVGMSDVSAGIVRVYPNPTKGTFIIEMNEVKATTQITILDIHGKKVYTQQTDQLKNELNLQNLSEGIYQVIIHDDKNRFTQKLIKL